MVIYKNKAIRLFDKNSYLRSGYITLLLAAILPMQSVEATEEHYFCGPDNPEEARSIETIIPALYKIVSGKAGSQKNWPLLKRLNSKNSTITPVFHDENGKMQAEPKTVDEFIELNETIFREQDFYEREIARKTFVFGHMATVMSQYESRKSPKSYPYAWGVNSFQLLNDGRRWCVISITWDSDNQNHRLKGLEKAE